VQQADGAAFFDVVRDFHLEGLVAKRLDAPYAPGKRSRSWRKVKAWDYSDLLICGVEGGRGRRSQRLGALHLARRDDRGQLRYAGTVGSGFGRGTEAQLTGLLVPLACERSPLDGWQPVSDVVCVQPAVTVRVRHLGYTGGGLVRQSYFDRVV
jgi:bifunctional non-homologous end joining protein LigD